MKKNNQIIKDLIDEAVTDLVDRINEFIADDDVIKDYCIKISNKLNGNDEDEDEDNDLNCEFYNLIVEKAMKKLSK